MAALRIDLFGGRIPRLAARRLPDSAAQQAMNTRLSSGELRPWWQPKVLTTLSIKPKSVYRYLHDGVAKFMAFTRYTYVVESALINDAFDRVYYSDADGFFITTKADYEAGNPASVVGVPPPACPQFAVEATGGTSNTVETRVYVTTLVTKYGEESAPANLRTLSGNADGAWRLTGLNSLVYDSATYTNVAKLRVYRTLTSGTGVDYRMVEEFSIGAIPSSTLDSVESTVLASRPTMDTLAWSTPVEGLTGVIAMSGGFNAGFKGRTVYFSEPYYPHAWPEDYQLAVEDDIVALGTYGNTLVIATKGRVAVAVGTTPAAMSLVTDGKIAPCVSAQGLVSTSGAVLYPSYEGLVSVSDAGVQVITQAFMTRDEWMRLGPENIKGALYENRYLGFYSSSMGFSFQFDDPATAWTDVQHPGVNGVATDGVTGRTLLLAGKDVLEWEGDTDNPMAYSWRSKPFPLPKPVNFAVLQLRAAFGEVDESRPDAYPYPDDALDDELGINTSGVNEGEAVNGPAAVATDDPSYSGVLVSLYVNRTLRWQKMVRSEAPQRLPSGYKGDEVEIEMSGSVPVFSVAIATTAKELEAVP